METKFVYKVLLANDDGIDSPGLISLAKALVNSKQPRFDVKIVAPSTQQTATGKSVSFNKPVRAFQKQAVDGLMGLAVEGTPADALIIGVKEHPDIDFVVSGINAGENTSIHSLLTSGTLAVCLEASLGYGLKGWAFSLDMDSRYFFRTTEEQETEEYGIAAKKSVEMMVKMLSNGGFPDKVSFISVNFPANLVESTPARIAKPSFNKYENYPIVKKDPRGIPYSWLWGDLLDPVPDTDTWYVKNGFIAVTPYQLQKLREIDENTLNKVNRQLQ
ncbi:MAG: 5'/3'-nucleotidase SurE [Candidatus Odinarchaeota archaeon]